MNQLKLQFIHLSFTPHIEIYTMIVTIKNNVDLHCKFWNFIDNYLFFTFTCRLYSRDTVRWKLTYNKLNRNMHWNMDRNPLEHFQKDNLRVCSCSNQVLEVIKLEDVYWYLRFTEEQASCFAWSHEVCLRPLHRKTRKISRTIKAAAVGTLTPITMLFCMIKRDT